MSLANRYTSSNMVYRRPDLYDYLASNDDSLTAAVHQLTADTGLGSALDLGCGTGRHLAALHADFGCKAVGVDVQPGLIDHGRVTYPELELVLGDIRSVRLDRQFDIVLCLGNSLSYQLTDADLQATVGTFAAHTRAGGYVLISTLLQPALGSGTGQIENEFLAAEVETASSWDADSRIVTTERTWRHRDGSVDKDVMRRRVTPIEELSSLLSSAGFTDAAVLDGGLVAARPR
ncbi:class I SAM-dependent methyltransferase [Kribbella deserti]|uniref:Class I SAM-dependent methyltransferase n=1 Tax=Kribbella deserti TaxID=1926257 RepID=A0ABV6QS19_9ACTN